MCSYNLLWRPSVLFQTHKFSCSASFQPNNNLSFCFVIIHRVINIWEPYLKQTVVIVNDALLSDVAEFLVLLKNKSEYWAELCECPLELVWLFFGRAAAADSAHLVLSSLTIISPQSAQTPGDIFFGSGLRQFYYSDKRALSSLQSQINNRGYAHVWKTLSPLKRSNSSLWWKNNVDLFVQLHTKMVIKSTFFWH